MHKLTESGEIFVRPAIPLFESIVVGAKRRVVARGLVLTGLILSGLALPAGALTISVTYDSSVTSLANAAQVETAFEMAA
ncbi:MAG TPA: hypothetical protein VJT54_01735, partial [Verrucomicrobiae bacterium]|nr:hypothetical protein [Verrucomicrobiae bacterium]